MSRHTFAFFFPWVYLCERYSLGARWVFSFSRCCYLVIDLSSHLLGGRWAPGPSRSHLDSAVELSYADFRRPFMSRRPWLALRSDVNARLEKSQPQKKGGARSCHVTVARGLFVADFVDVPQTYVRATRRQSEPPSPTNYSNFVHE